MPEASRLRRCAFYLRVSEDDGNKEGNSIEAQRAACRAYIQYQVTNGFPVEVVEEFVELGESGKDLERPKVKELLGLAKAKAIDVIVVYKLDRLSRSLLDFCKLAEGFKADGIEVVSTTQNLDSSTSHGRLMINILMTFAQYERELIQERTLGTMRKRAQDGKFNGGWIPLGYDYDIKTKVLSPNIGERAIYLEMCEMLLAGEPIERIAYYLRSKNVTRKPRAIKDDATRRGGRPLRPRLLDTADVRRILLNPLHAGLTKAGTAFFPGRHEALIDREKWDRVRALVLASKPLRVGVTQSKHRYLLNGVLWCGCCDAPMSGYRVGRDGPHYYACQRHRRGDGVRRCTTANLRVSALDEFAFRLLGEVSRLPEIVSAFVQMAKLEQQKHEEVQRQLSVIVASLEASRAQKSRVKEEIKAASSGAGRKEWRMELEKLLGQEGALQQELEILTARLQDDAADARIRKHVTEALGEAGKFVLGLSADARDQFLRATLRKVVVNASGGKEAESNENELQIRSSGEKGRYLLNIQFSESSLASMLSKHCAESSIKLGDWLPG